MDSFSQGIKDILNKHNIFNIDTYYCSKDLDKFNFRQDLAILLKKWERALDHNLFSGKMKTVPIAITSLSDQLIRKSLLYSPQLILMGTEKAEDDDISHSIELPDQYVKLIFSYYQLIERDLASVVTVGNIFHSLDMDEDYDQLYFNPYKHRCIIAEQNLDILDEAQYKKGSGRQFFKFLFPHVTGISLSELIKLVDNEEIFSKYHQALNSLFLSNATENPNKLLRNMVCNVDSQIHELNQKYLEHRSKKVYEK